MCRVPFDQPMYKVRVSVQRVADGHVSSESYRTSNVAGIVNAFGRPILAIDAAGSTSSVALALPNDRPGLSVATSEARSSYFHSVRGRVSSSAKMARAVSSTRPPTCPARKESKPLRVAKVAGLRSTVLFARRFSLHFQTVKSTPKSRSRVPRLLLSPTFQQSSCWMAGSIFL